jgi:hypothetical protein
MAQKDHVIHLANGLLTPDTPRSSVTRMAARAVSGGHVVIHFHGGLVPLESGLKIVERLLPRYQGAGADPLFFVWESGLLETLTNNFAEIAQEALFRLLWKRIAAIAERKLGQTTADRAAFVLPARDTAPLEQAIDDALDRGELKRLVTGEPVVTGRDLSKLGDFERLSLENELLADPQLTLEAQRVSNSLRDPAKVATELAARSPRVRGATRTLLDPHALDRLVERPQPGYRGLLSTAKLVKGIVAVSARVIARFASDRHHGFHATVVEEILRELYLANMGEWVWDLMKQDTEDAFGADSNVCGGTALLESLQQAIDPERPPRITLVGHSTGAIYISNFIRKAVGLLPACQRFSVVFLAPAAKFEVTAATLDAYRDRIDSFRMFTMKDDLEREDPLVKVLYPHSLLYFICGVLEGAGDVPVVGMARFYDQDRFPDEQFPDIATVRRYVEADAARVVWSVSEEGPVGRRSSARRHGDFDDDGPTLRSLEHILHTGF